MNFEELEVIKDVTGQLIDFTLNLRQSGHPGGSRSKMHAFWSMVFSDSHFDFVHPENPLSDRFILSAGHTVPLIYASLAVIGESFKKRFEETKDERFFIDPSKIVLLDDLLKFRHRDGLSGHAEFSGKTLFLKFNTGPAGHGLPASVGEAFALKRAGLDAKVWLIEGEGALSAGASHESKNSAYGLGLDNLYWLIDWNDFGIDDHPVSKVIHGTPDDWFRPYGWNVVGCEDGHDWEKVFDAFKKSESQRQKNLPNIIWFKTKKGYGYGVYDNKSHGSPHKANSEIFWRTREEFMEKYGVDFEGYGKDAPDGDEFVKQTRANLKKVIDLILKDEDLVEKITDELVQKRIEISKRAFPVLDQRIFEDKSLFDYTSYPKEVFFKPGSKAANRQALRSWGAWINAVSAKKYGRPLFLAASADLTESTNLSGFGEGFGDFKGYGWYDRDSNLDGVLLPQEITEFANAGISAGVASVNLSDRPYENFNGFWMATSTYGAFAYLKYGPYRLFSQMAQDCPVKLGKILWVVGHSGPETADDSRTHFGIFSTVVTQLFPKGHIINIYPWEANEVPVLLGAALSKDVPIVAIHLTRPPIEIPDRERIKIPSHLDAAKGAYLIRDFKMGKRDGTILVRGTMTTYNLLKILNILDDKYNLKIVSIPSKELFDMQPKEYREKILPWKDWEESMVITNESLKAVEDWIATKRYIQYCMSSDWDNRWRTGGTVDEVMEEAHLSPEYILKGIERFVRRVS
ncbi:MAG: transketolase-like TK C-terminal-containing protein [Athalassotoga sp.]|uniref:transketolase-like TK C-terminal-containing protein n=1 Tax=Athalassotoga sp. TaxID=2022597 RepID=UPI003D03A0C0